MVSRKASIYSRKGTTLIHPSSSKREKNDYLDARRRLCCSQGTVCLHVGGVSLIFAHLPADSEPGMLVYLQSDENPSPSGPQDLRLLLHLVIDEIQEARSPITFWPIVNVVYKQDKFISHSCRGGKYNIKVYIGLVLFEILFLGSQLGVLKCVLRWGNRASHDDYDIITPSVPNIITVGIRFSKYKLRETNIQTVIYHLSTYLPTHLPTCLSISLQLSVCLSIYLQGEKG